MVADKVNVLVAPIIGISDSGLRIIGPIPRSNRKSTCAAVRQTFHFCSQDLSISQ